MHRLMVSTIAVLVLAFGVGCDAAPNASPTPQLQQVALRTQPPPGPNHGCMEALLSGRLVPTAVSGIGVEAGGDVIPVAWPFGYQAVSQGGTTVLLDHAGRPVARVGDRIEMGGGHGDAFWYTCHGQLTVVN